MKDDICVVEVGIHPGPYWRDRRTGMVVCTRHRGQYEERAEEFGPFDWERHDPAAETAGENARRNHESRAEPSTPSPTEEAE